MNGQIVIFFPSTGKVLWLRDGDRASVAKTEHWSLQ